jgi:predicted nucleic-acid-binding protein
MESAFVVKSVDTNILVRLIVRDNPAQAETAALVMAQQVFIPITVLLETAWVLSSFYGFDRSRLNAALLAVLDNENVNVDDAMALRTALDLHRKGADIADVLHLVAARGTETFVTFDKGVPNAQSIGVDVELV